MLPLRPAAMHRVGNDADLRTYLQARITASFEYLMALDCAEDADQVLDRVRKLQMLHELVDDLAADAEVAAKEMAK